MSLVVLDNDPWLAEYESCEKLYQTITEQLHSRSSEARNSENYARISALIRVRLKQYDTEVKEVHRKLELLGNSRTITSEEYERRQRLIENLNSKNIQLLQRFNDRTKNLSNYAQDRSVLLGNKIIADGGTTGWNMDDDDDDRPNKPLLPQNSEWNVEQLREHQKRLVLDQDAGLESLSKVISRQKEIAVTINNEVETQNEIVDDIAVRMDTTLASSQRETAHIGVIMQKDSTWGYWLIILVLLFAIVFVAMV